MTEASILNTENFKYRYILRFFKKKYENNFFKMSLFGTNSLLYVISQFKMITNAKHF